LRLTAAQANAVRDTLALLGTAIRILRPGAVEGAEMDFLRMQRQMGLDRWGRSSTVR
jgi:hypothetical protein